MTPKFGTIMLPVDFSEHCDRAAEYAAWFAESSGGTVHVVHVIDNPADPIYEPSEVPLWVLVDNAAKKALERMEATATQCLPPSCKREFHVMHGDPFGKLMEALQSIKPDVIVMSSHGRGGIHHLVMGSVAEKIVRHANCPVFVVRRMG